MNGLGFGKDFASLPLSFVRRSPVFLSLVGLTRRLATGRCCVAGLVTDKILSCLFFTYARNERFPPVVTKGILGPQGTEEMLFLTE